MFIRIYIRKIFLPTEHQHLIYILENFYVFTKLYLSNYQVINKLKWKTFKLLITFLLFILSIQQASISLQPHLLIKQNTSTTKRTFTIKSKIIKTWKSKLTPTMKPLPNHWNISKATNWLQEFGSINML